VRPRTKCGTRCVASVLLWCLLSLIGISALALLVFLSARVGVRTKWRRIAEWCAYALLSLSALTIIVGHVGTLTLWFDPLPFWWFNSPATIGIVLVDVYVAILVAAAVASVPRAQRPRAGWLLLPIPVAFAVSAAAYALAPSAATFAGDESLVIFANVVTLLGAVFVTYALVKRRVLDTGFILSRTIVVAIISLVVVAAFVLLEWLLESLVSGASHATGLVANAALALVLGVSLRYIHRHVDKLVDSVLFRRRYENERSLRAFSTEAAFVTERESLLDRALEMLRAHTDARAAALLTSEDGLYKAAQRFGEAPAEVSENDPAILALKAWHKPVDPHPYASALHGDLAVPMLARGRLLGVLLCGERAGGEAYAPDEVEALLEFAHGVGSALDGLGDPLLISRDDKIVTALEELRETIERRLPPTRTS
jgi:hypothetical protein